MQNGFLSGINYLFRCGNLKDLIYFPHNCPTTPKLVKVPNLSIIPGSKQVFGKENTFKIFTGDCYTEYNRIVNFIEVTLLYNLER